MSMLVFPIPELAKAVLAEGENTIVPQMNFASQTKHEILHSRENSHLLKLRLRQ
jgi:hypothetical protein